MSEWIASKDRLPAQDCRVLIANKSCYRREVFRADFYAGSECFYQSFKFKDYPSMPPIQVDMWMLIDPIMVPNIWIDINDKTPVTSGFRRQCLVQHKDYGSIYLGWWDSEFGFFKGHSDEWRSYSPPPLLVTHWISMPEFPAELIAKNEK